MRLGAESIDRTLQRSHGIWQAFKSRPDSSCSTAIACWKTSARLRRESQSQEHSCQDALITPCSYCNSRRRTYISRNSLSVHKPKAPACRISCWHGSDSLTTCSHAFVGVGVRCVIRTSGSNVAEASSRRHQPPCSLFVSFSSRRFSHLVRIASDFESVTVARTAVLLLPPSTFKHSIVFSHR